MVAAYTRSDAGAGLGAAAKLPSDLRTPTALVVSIVNESLEQKLNVELPRLSSE